MGTTQRSEATSGWIAVGFLVLVALILLIADPLGGNGGSGDASNDGDDDTPFVAYIAPLEAPADPTFGFGDDGEPSVEQVDEVLGRTESSTGRYSDTPGNLLSPAAENDVASPSSGEPDARATRGTRIVTD